MIDKFGRKIDYLRISVTENCNLKCIYCIDENNILNSCNNDILTDDEIVKIATECARLGIKKNKNYRRRTFSSKKYRKFNI